MAKQTFTTGQVLTAAQMTSLQQTAMGGGDTTAKTTSYVLVAADAGTVVAMNAAGATTITVNTSLFAAGDTVFIQNRGAGVCTITAGTATVSTAGSLALGQHEGGTLYFTATGAAVFYDYVQTGAVSPLTTKGDIWGYSTLDARIPIGANDTVLTADSTQALGLKWATPTSGSLTLLSTTTLSGTSTTVSSISQSYTNLYFQVAATPSANAIIAVRPNNAQVSNLYGVYYNGNPYQYGSVATQFQSIGTNTGGNHYIFGFIYDYTSTAFKPIQCTGYAAANGGLYSGGYDTNGAITSLVVTTQTATTMTGTIKVYGVK